MKKSCRKKMQRWRYKIMRKLIFSNICKYPNKSSSINKFLQMSQSKFRYKILIINRIRSIQLMKNRQLINRIQIKMRQLKIRK
jgi:hypothetical protein